MARSRSISTDISRDKVVATLIAKHGPLAGMLYTWAIPHADDWGRLPGDASEFALLVCPALFGQIDAIEDALEQVADAGLWRRYTVGSQTVIAFPRDAWFRRQNYIGTEKRAFDGSKFAAPPGEEWGDWDSRPEAKKKPVRAAEALTNPQGMPRNAEECRESPQNPSSPSPTPTPTDRETEGYGEIPAPSRNGRPSVKAEQEKFNSETIAKYPHWEKPLQEQVERVKPGNPTGYRAKMLQNWLAGDGTPPEPEPPAPVRRVVRVVEYTPEEIEAMAAHHRGKYGPRFPQGTTEERAAYTVGGTVH